VAGIVRGNGASRTVAIGLVAGLAIPVMAMSPASAAVPDTLTELGTHGQKCSTGSERSLVTTTSPMLRARVSEPAGRAVRLEVWTYLLRPDGTSEETAREWPLSEPTGSGQIAQVNLADLADGQSYVWAGRAVDDSGATGAWTRCEFTVDITRPNPAPTVVSADGIYLADDAWHGGVDVPGSFTVSANGVADVTGFVYGFADPPTTYLPASAAGGSATVEFTPRDYGMHTLFVQSVDRAGNRSDRVEYTFGVAQGDGTVVRWQMREGAGPTLKNAVSTTADADAIAAGGFSWSVGRPGTTRPALTFDGTSGHAAARSVIDTSRSFSVAGWVRPTDLRGWRSVISQSGSSVAAFTLESNGRNWTFGLNATDATGTTTYRANSQLPPQLGTWTHLAATFDAVKHVATLYVDGVLNAQVNVPSHWNGTGGVELGRARYGATYSEYFAGDLNNVSLWDRALSARRVFELAADGGDRRLAGVSSVNADGEFCSGSTRADRAIDRDTATGWCATGNRSLTVGLSAKESVTGFAVRHAGFGGEDPALNTRDFDIEVSTNGTTFAKVAEVRGNTAHSSVLRLAAPVRATSVRLVVLRSTQTEQARTAIYELEIYSGPRLGESIVPGAIASGGTITNADPACASTETADKAGDGILDGTSKWCTAKIKPELTLDLGGRRAIVGIVVRHAGAGNESRQWNTRDYDIQASTDGVTWTPLAMTRGNSADATGHVFLHSVSVRYLRLTVLKPSHINDWHTRIHELEVYAG
jgi:hypothetical protein